MSATNRQLARTNADLDTFIYTASMTCARPSATSKAFSAPCATSCPPPWPQPTRCTRC